MHHSYRPVSGMIFALVLAVSVLFGPCGIVLAADYQHMSTEELSTLRGTMYSATQEEREAFRAEWLKRLEQMPPEERQRYLGSRSGQGQGGRGGTGLGDGSGMGRGSGTGTAGSGGAGGNGDGRQ